MNVLLQPEDAVDLFLQNITTGPVRTCHAMSTIDAAEFVRNQLAVGCDFKNANIPVPIIIGNSVNVFIINIGTVIVIV